MCMITTNSTVENLQGYENEQGVEKVPRKRTGQKSLIRTLYIFYGKEDMNLVHSIFVNHVM